MSHAFYADAANRSNRRVMLWYQNNLMKVLQQAKERQAREIDASIVLAEELLRKLDEPQEKPTVVPIHDLIPSDVEEMMRPVEQEVLDILHKSTEKGAVDRYMKERYKKAPEDKFVYRVVTSWDYGWQQKQAKQRARDVNHGRCLILRHTFYRRNNVAPDPPHYAQPSGGQTSICSEYACTFN